MFHSLDVDGNNVIDLEVCVHSEVHRASGVPASQERGAAHAGLASGEATAWHICQALSLTAPPEGWPCLGLVSGSNVTDLEEFPALGGSYQVLALARLHEGGPRQAGQTSGVGSSLTPQTPGA